MKLWQKILIPTVITLLVGGIYLFIVFDKRNDPGKIGRDANKAIPTDELVNVREINAAHFEDTLQLVGKNVWIKNGYTISYFPASASGQIDFHHAQGVLPALAKLEVKKVIKAAVPASVYDGMGHGTKQVFVVFTLPAQSATQLYAAPMGAVDGADEAYYCDILFYYDDPHTLFAHWPKDIWAAIDAHTAKVGMSELQTRLAVGQKQKPDSHKEGDRTVVYDQDGKRWSVTFENDKATSVQAP